MTAKFRYRMNKLEGVLSVADVNATLLSKSDLSQEDKDKATTGLRMNLLEARQRWETCWEDRSGWEQSILDQNLDAVYAEEELDLIDALFRNAQEDKYSRLEAMERLLKGIDKKAEHDPRLFKPGNITIPKFGGQQSQYFSFRSSFRTLYDNLKLSPLQRFWYLKQSVTAEAATVLAALPVEDSSYEEAWRCLDSRWGDRSPNR